jgi:hypothetical protein
MTSMHHRIAYRVTTAILALVMLSGGAADVPAGRALAPAGSRA